MPYKSDKFAIKNPKLDRRYKLTDDQKEKIVEEYATGMISQNNLAKKYGVSKRTIQFTLYPEKREIAKRQLLERQKEGRYYNKEKHKKYMKKHRKYKNELYKKGKLIEKSGKKES